MRFLDSIKELLLIYLIIVIICAFGFSYFEHKTIGDSIYWAFVTGMTVGYGDLYPCTIEGKIIAVLLMHLSVLIIMPLIIGNICSHCVKNKNEFTHEEQENIKQALQRIEDAENAKKII